MLPDRMLVTYCKGALDSYPATEKLAEREIQDPIAPNYLSTKSLHSRKTRNFATQSAAEERQRCNYAIYRNGAV